MKCLVTGGAGFIGSHLVDLCLEKGYEVIGIDNMSTGQQENIDLFIDNPNYDFVKVDLHTPFNPDIFQGVDYVFHLAGLADIIPSIESPKKYFDANVVGTINVLEASRKAGVKRFIYAASSSCFGIAATPTNEMHVITPMYPYALTKRLGEELVLHWGKVYKLPVVSLRLFNVFGPRARATNHYGAVFKTFFSQKLHGKPFTIVGDGSQTRDFTYCTDVARAFLMAAEKHNIKDQVINIGTGKPQSINYLADLIGGKDYPKEYLPWRPGEPLSTHADITKAKAYLKWKPIVSFEDGVKLMRDEISYWKESKAWSKEEIIKATSSWNKYLGDEKR